MKKDTCQQLAFDFYSYFETEILNVPAISIDKDFENPTRSVVIFLAEHRATKVLNESAPYFSEILDLVGHLK